MKQNFSDIAERNNESDRKWAHTSSTPDSIEDYRRAKIALLKQIMDIPFPRDPSETSVCLYKLGVTIACQIARTRIAETIRDGYIRTELSLVSENTRSFCAHAYDQLLSYIRQNDRMYIPDILERDPPDKQKRIEIFRQYDIQKQRAARDARKNNPEINRLFGSRG